MPVSISRDATVGLRIARITSSIFVHTNMFLIFKCRGESDLGLCTVLGLSKRMRLCGGDFKRILRPNAFFNWKSPPRSRIVYCNLKYHRSRPRSQHIFVVLATSQRCKLSGLQYIHSFYRMLQFQIQSCSICIFTAHMCVVCRVHLLFGCGVGLGL